MVPEIFVAPVTVSTRFSFMVPPLLMVNAPKFMVVPVEVTERIPPVLIRTVPVTVQLPVVVMVLPL